MAGREGRRLIAMLIAIAALTPSTLVTAADEPAEAAAPTAVPGIGSARPRVLYAPGGEAQLRARLGREPYRSVFITTHARATQYDGRALGDFSIGAQRDLSRAAKLLAFEYALDRTVIAGSVAPFPDEAARRAVGDRVRALLLNAYTRSRLAVPAPLGGFDRDINTSEEIVNYATAFDTMLGAGYDFGADRAPIVGRIASVTDELYTNYSQPETANNFALLNQNNHRSKSGAALAIAAVVLADDVAAAVSWWNYGVLQVDDVLRYILVTGDGAYGEGPYYYRYTMQNVLPLLRVWDRHLGAASWLADGIEVPAPLRHPLFRRSQRWMLDMALPDGTMAPVDDGNPGRSYYFGAVPRRLGDTAAGYWRWADTPQPFETDGSIDLGPDTIVTYDDRISPAPPSWAPTRFYAEGGNAIFRSGWDDDAVAVVALGEHDTASEFGRDRLGVGRAPQSHEHAEPGAFMLYAFGERLALDPGYLTFGSRAQVNKPEHHNVVLIDGAGPADYLNASIQWLSDPLARPPAEGQATIWQTFDGAALDGATVSTRYRDTEIDRRFLFIDDRYLVIADALATANGDHTATWMMHGNGGGTSGGTFVPTATGGRWEIGGARLDTGLAVAGAAPTFAVSDWTHEIPYGQARTHTAIAGSTARPDPQATQILYPTRRGESPPVIRDLPPNAAAVAGLELIDAAGDRRVRVDWRGVPSSLTVGSGRTDGSLLVVDETLDGSLRLIAAEDAHRIGHRSLFISTASPGTLSARVAAGRADLVVDTGDPVATVGGLPFTPVAVDGACGFTRMPGGIRLALGDDPAVRLRATAGNGRPAADAGSDRRVGVGAAVRLDGRSSCDPEHQQLTPHWELVSAPAGSAWTLTGAATWRPTLRADRVGPYRVRLVVTDTSGSRSTESEVLIAAGPRCGDGIDDDHDGRIDRDDPDCDSQP